MSVYVVRDGSHDHRAVVPLRKLTPPPLLMTNRMDIKSSELRSVIISMTLFFLSSVKCEIRCYCNQASCVSTGYMCKSSSFCFSDVTIGVHGCLEKRRCVGLRCCREDMCNYLEAQMQTFKAPISGSIGEEHFDDSRSISLTEGALRREVWLKAAIIAVPVAGICILILLVAIAARMLKQDAERQRRLLELRRVYGHSIRDTLLPWSKEKSSTIV
ncbi:BMP and activin membrane-bound inhibitor homolog [Parasteatoda tepidariorum]|uniref:BMP and activin membrane-bound inhibitor homolog n=1 Tax=Parasteatoda tepidariorum TaxID=114398 RepID=UPI00077FB7A7|nr:BMP and activin membrane-bound inhibitor homolog [Parasteatoda tepidariorum]